MSFSTTINFFGLFSIIFFVRLPVPGPISKMISSELILLFFIIKFRIFSLFKNFDLNFFVSFYLSWFANFIAYINEDGSDLFLPNIFEFGP